ncbi:anaerobic C4-dicarboxylate transporter family protein [Vibrio sinaloensis]|nr:anaerobic C4-dicarboxylate transporter family protein [Vibrio sinaloensis]
MAKRGLGIFLAGIATVIFVAMFGKDLGAASARCEDVRRDSIFLMLSVGALILLTTKVEPKKIVHSNVFIAGMTAVIIIFGIAWMSDTIIGFHKPYLISLVSDIVAAHPWTFAIAMFVVSVFLKKPSGCPDDHATAWFCNGYSSTRSYRCATSVLRVLLLPVLP